MLYKTYILPIIEYSNLCYCPTKAELFELEQVQRTITKYICNKMQLFDFSYVDRLYFLRFDYLYVRFCQILKLVYFAYTNQPQFPNRWLQYFKFKDTRNGIVLETPQIRIEAERKLFFNYAICLFNQLPKSVRVMNNLSSFLSMSNEYFSNNDFFL